jgi:hypothetical protein
MTNNDTTFNHEAACKAYAELSRRIQIGAYDELEPDGSYREDGDDVLKDHDRLDREAWQRSLKFVGHDDGSYTLEPMTEDERRAYLEASIDDR